MIEAGLSVRRAAMVHAWETLTFLHWRTDPDAVARLLPDGLVVETFGGEAWVGLVPFHLQVALGRGPTIPWVCRFAETNVRTYVRAADGSTGIWFCSLDAERLGAVIVARASYRLPYFWSDMSIEWTAHRRRYRTRRRWPGPRGATSDVTIEIGAPLAAAETTELDYFLTTRRALYSAHSHGISKARAEHAPWPLYRATAVHVDDELIVAAGLPAPEGEPVVHYADRLDVRIGWPHRLEAQRVTSARAER